MKVINSRDTLAAIPAAMARAINRIADREGVSVAAVIKRMLQQALIAEGELELTPRPRPTSKRIFERLDTGVVDDTGA